MGISSSTGLRGPDHAVVNRFGKPLGFGDLFRGLDLPEELDHPVVAVERDASASAWLQVLSLLRLRKLMP